MSNLKYTWRNWEGNQYSHAEVITANSVEDLRKVIERAKTENKTIRISSGGRGHRDSASYSASSVVKNDGEFIVMTPGLNKAIVHKDGSNRIKAEVGMSIGELDKLAKENGLSFETMPVPVGIQVGGAVATGSHGVTNHGGTLSDLVVGMEILLADGSIKIISGEEPEMLKAAQVHLGVLGIVINVTFQCVPLLKLATVDAKVDLKNTIDKIENIVDANDYVDLFWFPYTKEIWLKTWNRVPDDTPLKNVPGTYSKGMEWLKGKVSTIAMEIMIRFNKWTPLLSKLLLAGIEQKKRVAFANDIYHYQRYFPVKLHDLSYNIDVGPDFENFKKCFYKMVETVEEYSMPKKSPASPWPWAYRKGARFPQKFTTHIRFIKTSKGYMAPAYRNKFSVYLEALTYFGSDYKDYYNELEKYWLQFGARPHWGKTYSETQDFENIFGEGWHKFNEIRREMDPNGMFLNNFMKHVFKVDNGGKSFESQIATAENS